MEEKYHLLNYVSKGFSCEIELFVCFACFRFDFKTQFSLNVVYLETYFVFVVSGKWYQLGKRFLDSILLWESIYELGDFLGRKFNL